MKYRKLPYTRIALLGLIALVACLVTSPAAASQPVASHPATFVPEGFHLVRSAPGVKLYRKDYPKGNPDFVQVIDLSQGAQVKLMHGTITDLQAGEGDDGGSDPRFKSHSLEKFWQDFSISHPSAFCVTNGQFFYMPEEPTRIAFSLKIDGVVVNDGWGLAQFPGNKLMLELWPDHANISEFTRDGFYQSAAPDVLGGLTERANKNAKKYVGRTFIGIDDRDVNGYFETLMIFNTLSARQVDASKVLRDFGAAKVMMLDGGGSAQLICEGESYVSSDRYIPQALGIAAGPEPTPIPALKKVERAHSLPKSTPQSENLALSPGGLLIEKESLQSPLYSSSQPAVRTGGAELVSTAVLPLSALIFLLLMRVLKLKPREG